MHKSARRYSLRVAGGPGQLHLLEDEDGSGDVIRRALHLVWRQREEIRSAVREPGRRIRMDLLRAGTRGHDAADDAGDRGPHACYHHDGGGGGDDDDDGGGRALNAGVQTRRSWSTPSVRRN